MNQDEAKVIAFYGRKYFTRAIECQEYSIATPIDEEEVALWNTPEAVVRFLSAVKTLLNTKDTMVYAGEKGDRIYIGEDGEFTMYIYQNKLTVESICGAMEMPLDTPLNDGTVLKDYVNQIPVYYDTVRE